LEINKACDGLPVEKFAGEKTGSGKFGRCLLIINPKVQISNPGIIIEYGKFYFTFRCFYGRSFTLKKSFSAIFPPKAELQLFI